MSQELLYYRHSGRISLAGMLAVLGVGAAAAIVGGALYAAFILICHIIYINVFASMLFGFLLAKATERVLKTSQIRSRSAVYLLLAVTSILALWAAWLFWVYFFLRMHTPLHPSLWGLITRPDALGRLIVAINGIGVWQLSEAMFDFAGKGSLPSRGPPLWVVWAVEAFAVTGPSLYYVRKEALDTPFCEKCRVWSRQLAFAALQKTDPELLKHRLEMRDFAFLQAIAKAEYRARKWVRVTVHGCPRCTDLRTLSVENIREELDSRSRWKTIPTPLIEWLYLTDAEAQSLIAFTEKLDQQEDTPTETADSTPPQSAPL